MTTISFIQHDGRVDRIEDARPGASVMEVAVRNAVPGIDADCGGACACATCHVYVSPEWLQTVGPRTDMEQAMLEFAEGVQENSRLACQIRLDESLDGLVVQLPEHQH
ncbi:2Fe-2S iron-sulfur cluster-binding protein [Phenylobacterium sp. VNQ135]|uniref:2Fe-2S iron-sulfur cluster-binding protein n=1 Tax=Phenylobacterium sp. VNQ135 TaxID=3400922 RepID=UPI003C034DA5